MHYIMIYFFNIVFILFLIYFFKLYFIHVYSFFFNYLNFFSNYLNFFFFSDTLICLALFITAVSWIFLGERYQFNNIFFLMYFFIFIICTIGMVSTSNLLVMIIFFEFLFLPSLFFVYKFGYSHKVEKTIYYLLLWTMTGSLLVLSGTAYLFSITNDLNINNLLYLKFSNYENNILMLLFFFGFGVKIPIWPFHYWLTKVHVEAPTGFSIFLSGFLVKTAFFCLVYFYQLFITPFFKNIILCFILIGSFDASLRMWSVTDIKRLIAFATIQDLISIFSFFVLLVIIFYSILNLFLLVHGILSGFLFFLVDQVYKQFMTRQLSGIAGINKLSPTLHAIVWFAILIFRGFPIFIKFFIEYELLIEMINNFYILGALYFFIISFFGVIGFSRVWLSMLYGQPTIKTSRLMFKRDFIIGFSFISLLFLLQFFF